MAASAPKVFGGAIAKLERAATHLQDLSAAVAAFRERTTYSIEAVGNLGDPDARHVHVDYVFRQLEPMPDEWSAILGDFLNNLRSALDHAVWELAVRNVGPQPPKASSIYFPISITETDFEHDIRWLRGVLSVAEIARVRSVQPFADPPPDDIEITAHPLVLLHR